MKLKNSLSLYLNTGVPPEVFKEAEFEKYDKYHSEDLIQGTLKNNCKFGMSKVLTQNRYLDEHGRIQYSTIFDGLFARIETPKPFNSLLYLRRDEKDKSLSDKILFGELDKLPFDNLRIQLDSSEFEKKFDIYASDKITAMQLLTADIMQELIKLYNETSFEFTIKNNYIYIRFSYWKIFETADLEKFSLDKDTLYRYYRVLKSAFNLIDRLLELLYETQYN